MFVGDNSTGANRTPKRTANLQKRRISDSPLMYAPWKVKLKKQERDVNVFIANFEQFNNPPVVQKQEKEPEPSTSEKWPSESENLNNSEKVLESSEDTEMRLVYPVDETRMDTVSEKRNITNLNDLFDDEIDDSMVRFSQQVEEEFFGRLKEEKIETSPILFSGKENESTTNDNQSIRKIEDLHNLMKVPFEKEKEVPNSSVPKSTYIPDDSFDECLSQFEEVDFSSELKNDGPRSKLKGLQIRNTDLLSKKSLFSCNSNNTSIKVGSGRSRSFLDSPKLSCISERSLIKTKSFEHHSRNGVKNLTKDFVQKNDTKPESHISPRKFFKTKSLSEPFHNDPKNCGSSNNNKETNNNPGTENKRKLVGKSFQCKIYSDTSLNRSVGNLSSKSLGSSQESMIIGNNFDNLQLSNLNRSVRIQDERTTESQTVLCTPQEIERKRREAKMKLEARRLQALKMRNPASSLPIKQSVKR